MDRFRQQLNAIGETVGAVVLAGGLARRMGGQDKGLVTVHQRPMAAWVVDTIGPSVDRLIVNANRNRSQYEALGAEVVADTLTGHLGPLAGLSAAMCVLDTDYIFMCPCDSPFIDPTLLDHLGLALLAKSAEIAVAHDGERLQPVFSVLSRSLRHSLLEFLENGERKIDKWYSMHSMIEVDSSSYRNSFRNINTDDERIAAEAELAQRGL